MIKILSTCCFLCCACVLTAQLADLPTERRYDWSEAGNTDLTETTIEFDLSDWADNGDYDAAIAAALTALEATGGTLYFPMGTYLLTQTITLPNGVHLEGAGADETHLQFDLGGSGHLIEASGSLGGSTLLTADALRGDRFVRAAAHDFTPGDYLRTAMNDDDLITSGWATGSVGQIARVTETTGDTIWLDRALRLDLPTERTASVRRMYPSTDVGVHCLSIDRNDATDGQTSHIYLQRTVGATVEGVASKRSNFAHVDLRGSARAIVRHNYFYDAHRHGGGGQGYGVVLQFASSDCLVENNIFDHLRHSMLLQAGANGNVLAYNYSIDPYWTGTTLPDDAAGDLVLHGNYPFANLFEGNQVQNIVIDESHGANGPHNTFYRNRAEAYGIVMGFGGLTDAQNFVGNEITGTADGKLGYYFLSGTDHFQQGNLVKENVTPTETTAFDFGSLFRDQRPAYFDAALPEPLFGTAAAGAYSIPAMYRYAATIERAVCTPGFYLPLPPPRPVRPSIQTTASVLEKSVPWTAGPNPVRDLLRIQLPAAGEAEIDFVLYDAAGRVARRFTLNADRTVSVAGLPAGLYALYGAGSTRRLIIE